MDTEFAGLQDFCYFEFKSKQYRDPKETLKKKRRKERKRVNRSKKKNNQ